MISVIIPTKNNAATIGTVLDMVFAQVGDVIEVVVIDSGSTDGTLTVLRKFPQVFVTRILPEDFGHGKTRNYGARLAKGEAIVFLNADAVPVNRNWLANLVAPLRDGCVAGVYSRQFPRLHATPFEQLYTAQSFGPIKEVKSLHTVSDADFQANIGRFTLFSSVSCAIRRDVFEKLPFKDDILIGEDQEWARRALEAGHTLVYEPLSLVYHSHNYAPIAYFRLNFDSAVAFQAIHGAQRHNWRFPVWRAVGTGLATYQSSRQMNAAMKAGILGFVAGAGAYVGERRGNLPLSWQRKFTGMPWAPEFKGK